MDGCFCQCVCFGLFCSDFFVNIAEMRFYAGFEICSFCSQLVIRNALVLLKPLIDFGYHRLDLLNILLTFATAKQAANEL